VYSFGVVLWELLSRETPYRGMSLAAIAVGVLRDDLRPAPLDEFPAAQRFEPLEAIMVECWHRDPAMRPSFHDIMSRVSAIGPKPDTSPLHRPRSSNSASPLSSDHSWGLDSLAAPATDVEMTVAFSDIADAASLWEWDPPAMREAMLCHNELLRRLLKAHHGYESSFAREREQKYLENGEGYFCMAFEDPADAVRWHARPATFLRSS
jgi:hypothetical protein